MPDYALTSRGSIDFVSGINCFVILSYHRVPCVETGLAPLEMMQSLQEYLTCLGIIHSNNLLVRKVGVNKRP